MRSLFTRKTVWRSVFTDRNDLDSSIKAVKNELISLGVNPKAILRVWQNLDPGSRHDKSFFIEIEGLDRLLVAEVDFHYLTAQALVRRLYYVGSEWQDRYYLEVPVNILSDLEPVLR